MRRTFQTCTTRRYTPPQQAYQKVPQRHLDYLIFRGFKGEASTAMAALEPEVLRQAQEAIEHIRSTAETEVTIELPGGRIVKRRLSMEGIQTVRQREIMPRSFMRGGRSRGLKKGA